GGPFVRVRERTLRRFLVARQNEMGDRGKPFVAGFTYAATKTPSRCFFMFTPDLNRPFHRDRLSCMRISRMRGMGATLPLAGLEIRRTVRLSGTAAVFSVSETVTNQYKLGRIYNIVQHKHATIGPPFLDETTVVDSNAQRGF